MLNYQPSKLLKKIEGYDRPHELLASNDNSELILVRGVDRNEDPRYYFLVEGPNRLANEDAKVVLGMSGMLESISSIVDTEEKILIERKSAGGHFQGPKLGAIEMLIDISYKLLNSLKLSEQQRILFDWNYGELKGRFRAFNDIVDHKIIPDFEDHTLPFLLASDCFRKCSFCKYSLSGKPFFLTKKESESEIDKIRSVVETWHSGFEHTFQDGFLSSPDLLRHKLVNATDPLDTIPMIYQAFPYLKKFGSFVGLESVVELHEQDPLYLTNIAKWVSRWYSGIETTHEGYSFAIGKNIPTETKLKGMKIASNISYVKKRKWIVMVGFGPGVRAKDGTVYSTEESIIKTAKDIARMSDGSEYTVEISQFDSKNTRLDQIEQKRAQEGNPSILLPYQDRKIEVQKEIDLFKEIFQTKGVYVQTNIRTGYEVFLPLSPTPRNVF